MEDRGAAGLPAGMGREPVTPPAALLHRLAVAVNSGRDQAGYVGEGFFWTAWLDGDRILVSIGLYRCQPRADAFPFALTECDDEGRAAILQACEARMARAGAFA